jgi:hypothetical protein
MRVSAQADFAQLKREMKGLNSEFNAFKNTIARGFGQGFLSGSQSRSMDFNQKQMQKAVQTLNSLLDEQESKIKRLQNTKITSNKQNKEINDEITMRRRNVDIIQAEIRAMEDRQKVLSEQARELKVIKDGNDKKAGGGGGGGILGGIGNVVGSVLGIAGIAGLTAFITQSIQASSERHITAARLGMKIGAQNSGDFYNIVSQYGQLGLPQGFNGLESMQQMESFVGRGGRITMGDLQALQQYAVGSGDDIGGVISAFSEMKRFGSSRLGGQREFADMIATSIAEGNMQERSAEALETLTGLVGDIAQDMPNVDASNIAAIQAIMNKSGIEAFRGERGADILSGINETIQGKSGNKAVQYAMYRALGWGTDKTLWETMLQSEEGLTPENLAAFMSVSQSVQGNPDLQGMTMMAMGNGKISAHEAQALLGMGGQLTAENIQAMKDKINLGGTLDANTSRSSSAYGNYIRGVDAELDEAMAGLGDNLLKFATAIKDHFTDLVTVVDRAADLLEQLLSGKTPSDGLGAVLEQAGILEPGKNGTPVLSEKGTKTAAGLSVGTLLAGGLATAAGATTAGPLIAGAGALALLGVLGDKLAKSFGHDGLAGLYKDIFKVNEQEAKKTVQEAEKGSSAIGDMAKGVKEGFGNLWDSMKKWWGGSPLSMGGNVYAADLAAPMMTMHNITSPLKFGDMFNRAGQQYGIDPSLIAALTQAESGFDPNAVSPMGALGLTQLMPYNLDTYGVKDWRDPEQNIFGGTRFLADRLKDFGGDPKLAIASYNMGPNGLQGLIDQYGTRDWNTLRKYAPEETRNYVDSVMSNWQQFSGDPSVLQKSLSAAMPALSSGTTATAQGGLRMTYDINVNVAGVSEESEGVIKQIAERVFTMIAQKQQTGLYAFPSMP